LRTPHEWRGYLREHSELRLRTADERERGRLAAEQLVTGWLGYEPATELTVSAAEQRLGVRLPPSFRGFLLASDGWSEVGGWIDKVHSCDGLAWFRDTDEGAMSIEVAEAFFGEVNERPEDEDHWHPPTIFERSLLVAGGVDYDVWLLDPAGPGADGEWIAWRYQTKGGEVERFASFAELFHFCREEVDLIAPSVTEPTPIRGRRRETGPLLPESGVPLGRRVDPGRVAAPDMAGGEGQPEADESID
jgi:hypothetical protein